MAPPGAFFVLHAKPNGSMPIFDGMNSNTPLLVRLIVNAFIVFGLAWALPGIEVNSYWTALLVALVLGLLNVFLKPIITILTLPFTLITLGLFLFVINAFIVWLAGELIGGFKVSNFWWALLFSMLMTALNSVFYGSSRRTPPTGGYSG